MRCNILILFACLASFSIEVMAQNKNTINGTVRENDSKEALPSATIVLQLQSSPDKKMYTTTDNDGKFIINNVADGNYSLIVSYVGFKTATKKVDVRDGRRFTFNFNLSESTQRISGVAIEARATRAEQKGDTLVYNAEAFKVMDGSSAEDLISKMPGIVVEGGNVQAQGEDVKKILVDGKEFFDGDVNLALKNIPSDIIANIEVFDKKSEQAEFTGFDDGEDIKTLNITTKTGFRQGKFGEVSAGYGTDDRYKLNGNFNIFNNDQRLSLLGMSNNVNQQNFSQEDLSGVISSTQGGKRGRGGRGSGSKGGGKGGKGMGDGGSQSKNFMLGSTNGISSTDGLGLNYVGKFNDNINITGSYFFNKTGSELLQDIDRTYFESVLPGLSYKEYNESRMTNFNHRVNLKFDYKIDENNSLMIRPTLSFQDNKSSSFMTGENIQDGLTESSTENTSNNKTDAYRFGAELVYRHKFAVEGRTLSLMFNGNMSNTDGYSYSDYINRQFGNTPTTDEYSLYKKNLNKQYSLRGNAMFTEKLSDMFQLQLDYKASYSNTDSDRKTYNKSTVTDLFDQLDEELSNVYSSDYITQSAGVGLKFKKDNFSAMIGSDMQWSSLKGYQTYPLEDNMEKNFFSALPSFTARYRIDKYNSFMFRYRSNSQSPSINDLQDVIDDTNPLFLSSGNPDLDQQINHSANLRYIRTTQTGKTFIAMVGATIKSDYIADSTYIAQNDILLKPGITLSKGSQYSSPVNMNGYYSLQSMLTYGIPVDFLKSNVNFSISANYSKVPTIFNGESSKTSEVNIIPKIIVGSNISKDLDFTLSYSAGINKAFNSISGSENSDYLNQTAAAKVGWNIWNNLIFRSNFTYTNYSGLSDTNSDFFLWNASIGKKILKNKAAEIKLEAYDILKQNSSFNRTVGSNYYDYTSTNVLKPYVMLSFVYTIR